MRRATFLASVRSDLLNILSYITDDSGSVAVGEEFVRQFRAKCHKLAALPNAMGRPRPELRADIRSFPSKGYVIFFRYIEQKFEVVNIVEGHRDIDAYFGGRSRTVPKGTGRGPAER